jgi:hypothetical protein
MGVLALIPWTMELWNVFRFLRTGRYIRELDYEEMEKYIRFGALLHGFLMILAAIVGTAGVIGKPDAVASLFAAAAHLASGLLSFLVWHLYKTIFYRTYTGKELRKVENSGQNEIIQS